MEKITTCTPKKEKIIVNQLIKEDCAKDSRYKTLKINGNDIDVFFDSGSDINIVDQTFIIEKGLRKEKCTAIQVNNIFGKVRELNECCDVTINTDDMILTAQFYIANLEQNNIKALIGNNLIKEIDKKKKELKKLQEQHRSLFNNEKSEGYEGVLCEINTPPGKKVNVKYKKINQSLMEGATKAINKMLEEGYIEPSKSSWCNPLKPVQKPTGEVRITSNMQFLNNLVESNNYTVPYINEIIEKTKGNRFFTVIDLKDAYFQIKIKQEDKHKTAFYFKNKLYQYTRMPQGFKNSSAIFQMIMDDVLKEFLDKCCSVYLDDVIIYGKTEEEHDYNLKKILETIERKKFKINISKMQYKLKKVKILGKMIDGELQTPIESQQNKVLEFKTPKTKKEVQRFVGFANYYRKYIENFATIAIPLYESLKGKSQELNWTKSCQEAFEEIKRQVNSNIAVHIPDFNLPFVLTTDASNTGIGVCLQQKINDELKVVAWDSKKLTPAETKWTITEKEFLAMSWGIEQYEYYLKGRKFTVITDHSAILAMKTKPIFGNLRLERMRERLQEYDFEIFYKKGETLIEADTLSRIYEESETRDSKNKNVLIGQDNKWYYKVSETEIKYFPDVPERREIIEDAHLKATPHGGTDATIYEIRKNYWWPKLAESVKEFIKTCEQCIKNDQKSEGGEIFITTKSPLEIAAIDLMFVDQKHVLLTFIDYFTRLCKIKVLETKNASEVISGLESICNEIGYPKTLTSDNGKEFCSSKVEKWLVDKNIIHNKVSVEKHQENGRVERLHRKIWQALRKENENADVLDNLEDIIDKINTQINNTYHRGIKMTPEEAWMNPNNKTLIELNSKESEYEGEFKKGKRETFNEGDEVWIKNDAIESQYKLTSRFGKEGIIHKVLNNDTYLVDTEGRFVKRSHSQLKRNYSK